MDFCVKVNRETSELVQKLIIKAGYRWIGEKEGKIWHPEDHGLNPDKLDYYLSLSSFKTDIVMTWRIHQMSGRIALPLDEVIRKFSEQKIFIKAGEYSEFEIKQLLSTFKGM